MKKISILFIIFLSIFYSKNTFSYGVISNTVPGEGGYGTITYESGGYITGTFHRKYHWCKDCTWRLSGDNSVIIKGDLILVDGSFSPKSNSAVFTLNNRDFSFTGNYISAGGIFRCGQGTATYKDKNYKIRQNFESCYDLIDYVESKYSEEQFADSGDNNSKSNDSYNNDEIIPASSGSGFLINNNGTIITNFHVVDSCDNVNVFKDGRKYNADVVAQDKVNDLGILRTSIKSKSYYSISSRNVFLLEDIIVAGFPLGKQISSAIKTFEGSVSSLTGLGDNYSNFQIDANLNQGNSGGPIINYEGNVVGIAVAKLIEEGVEGFNFGIKSSVLKDFLDVNNIAYTLGGETLLSKKELSPKIVSSTVYIECWMSYAKIKRIMEEEYSQKALFKLN